MTNRTIWKFSKNVIFTLKNYFFSKFLVIVDTKKSGLGTNLDTKKCGLGTNLDTKKCGLGTNLSTKKCGLGTNLGTKKCGLGTNLDTKKGGLGTSLGKFLVFGPSGVRALPVAAGTNEGGH